MIRGFITWSTCGCTTATTTTTTTRLKSIVIKETDQSYNQIFTLDPYSLNELLLLLEFPPERLDEPDMPGGLKNESSTCCLAR